MPTGKWLGIYTAAFAVIYVLAWLYVESPNFYPDMSGTASITLLVLVYVMGISAFIGVLMKIFGIWLRKIGCPKVIRTIIPCLAGVLLIVGTVKVLFFTTGSGILSPENI